MHARLAHTAPPRTRLWRGRGGAQDNNEKSKHEHQQGDNMKTSGKYKTLAACATVLLVAGIAAYASSRQTKYASSTSASAARLVFAPARGVTLVKHVAYSTDKSLGKITFKGRTGNALTPTAIDSTEITMDNASFTLSNDYEVVWVYATGAAPEYRTVSDATTTNVTLDAALTGTGTTADRLYCVTTQGVATVGANGAAAGTNSIGSMSGDVFATPGASPLVIEIESVSNSTVQATVEL
jgi:hypothetical protein